MAEEYPKGFGNYSLLCIVHLKWRQHNHTKNNMSSIFCTDFFRTFAEK